MLEALPSKISYSTLVIKLDDGQEISIPRRELWDVRVQLMAEEDDEGLGNLGKDDVRTGVYEGGFKSWESSVDLVKELYKRKNEASELPRRVLELGCGTALPSLAVFQWLLQTSPSSMRGLHLALADYNPTVLQLVTLPNVLLSWAQTTKSESWEIEGELELSPEVLQEFSASLKSFNIQLSFFSGAWSPEFVDIVNQDAPSTTTRLTVIGAETIYSPAALNSFAETLMSLLSIGEAGEKTALVAAKKVYFGVGGSMEDFCDMANPVRKNNLVHFMKSTQWQPHRQMDTRQGGSRMRKPEGHRPLFSGSVQEIIDQYNTLGAALAAQAPPPDTSVQYRDETADGVPVRIYTPPAANEGKLPVGVYYHGGGYLLGGLDEGNAFCCVLAKQIPCIIVSVDYRLSTTHKMPIMLEDSLAAYKWGWQNAEKLGGNQSKVFAIGGSAGGGLALTVTDQLIKSGLRSHVQGIVALCPITAHPSSIPSAYASQYTSYVENGSGVPLIDAASLTTFFEAAGVDYHDEKVFVTLSKRLGEFPPTYITTCGKDPLRDDGRVLEAMLRREGARTMSDVYEG
ncbi:Versiconal hemiacetal acetate esterase, partial [Lachnellula suecica]